MTNCSDCSRFLQTADDSVFTPPDATKLDTFVATGRAVWTGHKPMRLARLSARMRMDPCGVELSGMSQMLARWCQMSTGPVKYATCCSLNYDRRLLPRPARRTIYVHTRPFITRSKDRPTVEDDVNILSDGFVGSFATAQQLLGWLTVV